jgi:dTDP-4-dehydrorhamnose reductase
MELTRQHRGTPTARVEPVTTAEYPTRAARPMYSALDCSRIHKHFGIAPRPWQKSLEEAIRQLLANP